MHRYTGNDLKNPSCWDKSVWAPSVSLPENTCHLLTLMPLTQDDSFACAVTLDGWADRPKCFRFLERALITSLALSVPYCI